MSERTPSKFPMKEWTSQEIEKLKLVTKDVPKRGVRKIIVAFGVENQRSADAVQQKYHQLKREEKGIVRAGVSKKGKSNSNESVPGESSSVAPEKKVIPVTFSVIPTTEAEFMGQLFVLLASKVVKSYNITKAKISITLK